MSREAIDRINLTLQDGIAGGDWAQVAACYTPNARLLVANTPIFEGRDAIISFFQGAKAQGVDRIHLNTTDLDEQGDTAIEMGRYWMEAPDGQKVDEGHYVVVWKNGDEGWQLHWDIPSSDQPATA